MISAIRAPAAAADQIPDRHKQAGQASEQDGHYARSSSKPLLVLSSHVAGQNVGGQVTARKIGEPRLIKALS